MDYTLEQVISVFRAGGLDSRRESVKLDSVEPSCFYKDEKAKAL